MHFLIVCDPLSNFDLAGDTTYALMLEIVSREHSLWVCTTEQLYLRDNTAWATCQKTNAVEAVTPSEAFTQEVPRDKSLQDFEIVLMRSDPPVDARYLQATWILDHVPSSTNVINAPRGLRELNEHLSILRFPSIIPKTLVTSDIKKLDVFLDEVGGAMVIKPVDGFGGLGVYLVRRQDPNRSALLEAATNAGKIWTMAQEYLPEIEQGDKRILLANGTVIGSVLRVPSNQQLRGNLHVGGSAQSSVITQNDKKIIEAVSPVLKEYGQVFVGIDVIGDKLTEINITSPTGIRHIDKLTGQNTAKLAIDEFIDYVQ